MDVSCLLDYPTIPAGERRKLHLLVRIETWPEEGGPTRKPLNIAVVIDRSGSMDGEKIERTKDAAVSLVEQLASEDVLSIVTYCETVEVPLAPTAVTDKDSIKAVIRGIITGGTTNLSGGWLRGLSLLGERENEDYLHRVLLLTDGKANEGITREEDLVEIARQHQERGLTTTTVGFGTGFNESLLGAIAREGGGRFHYVRTPDEVPGVFLEEFGQLARVFGQNLEVRIETAEGVEGPEVFGEKRGEHAAGSVTTMLGDIRERDRKQVLATLTVPQDLAAGEQEIATIHVAYDAVRGKIGRRQHVLPVTVTVAAEAGQKVEPDPEVVLEVVVHKIACMKREAVSRLDAGDGEEARGQLQRARRLVARHRALSSDLLDRESKVLKDMLAHLERAKAAGGLAGSKVASQQEMRDASIMLRTYVMDASARREQLMERRPDVDLQSYVLSPETKEALEDIVGAIRSALADFGHAPEFIDRAESVTRELVMNALEHGCKGADEPRVEVETRCSRNYFKVVVEDNGPGFDAKATLEEASASASDTSRSRGRGLLIVREMVDELDSNEKGNRVSATISRERLDIQMDEAVSIGPAGVGKVGVVTVDGNLDTHTVHMLESRARRAIGRGFASLVLDLSNCRYISSSGIGTIMALAHEAEDAGGRVVVAGLRSLVERVFEAMGLTSVITVVETVDEALKLFESRC